MPEPTVEQLWASYRVACRKPRAYEEWCLENVPKLLARLECQSRDAQVPTCAGDWLVFDARFPGDVPRVIRVMECHVSKFKAEQGKLYHGPLPTIDLEEGDMT